MADPNSEPTFFEGTSPKECEIFVATIRRRALDRGKSRDNEWMADFAASHFVGDAFYWFESLDQKTQNDWERLRPALVARFGRGGLSSAATSSAGATPASTVPITIPTPAAAPPIAPPHSTVRKGHLKVLNQDGTVRGYLLKTADGYGRYTNLGQDRENALVVSTPPSLGVERFELQVEGRDSLAICWPFLNEAKWMEKTNYHATCCSWSNVTSKRVWATEQKVWKISDDGELSAEYPKPNGGSEILRPYDRKLGDDTNIAWLKLNNSYADSCEAFKIVFEDVN